jgi:hypothetical protein
MIVTIHFKIFRLPDFYLQYKDKTYNTLILLFHLCWWNVCLFKSYLFNGRVISSDYIASNGSILMGNELETILKRKSAVKVVAVLTGIFIKQTLNRPYPHASCKLH